ncbi:DEAD/DEAH box helicase [Thiocystis violascens]|uniref:Restriction endonuclease n=1 Tax=Thiocystis violascens (strain ATCC 17096 / DSM 198 / 6111) TaxID=765911 RepID=I3YEN1_THIV6|nr:DEAD/DEAH box helicase family protein [Thiocystis violascens]AFL75449.1 restriction endonuclease [Thiocystis violascens DSM 198]
MPLRDLDYQARVLTLFDAYLTELSVQKAKADKISAANAGETDPDLLREVPDFPAKTWSALKTAGQLPPSRVAIPYSPRLDGIGRPTPNAVFKVPTGGGKTYLAVAALSRLFGRYLSRNTGFVLWIVPNEAIYSQTKRQLTDRQHPYRQMLDRAAAGRVRILEKGDPLDARDVESHLCVMLLMLPSANRQSCESLRMFRDRGDVRGFFPRDDQQTHAVELERIPNLDIYDLASSTFQRPQIKDSLGNALRLIRPVVVMDEGHKAISELAFATLYGFNPCFVLELTATPKDVAARGGASPRSARHANILVEVAGTELDREGMIKMPLNLDPRQGTDWRNTLSAALDCLNRLHTEARRLHGERGRYIRPILLVQVERTGRDQRDGVHIHALDARDWLLTAGLDAAEIAIKTADTNELANPENQDLLSPANRVRVIITKQALQEGWDCPFAYVLCALAASQNRTALTQLVGRILRQPQADKTGIPLLDESYVITHHATTADVVEAIKTGLEEDGLGDLVKELRIGGDSGGCDGGARSIPRRAVFATTEIYLPQVLAVNGGRIRPLDYEQDILFHLDWSALDPAPLIAQIPDNAQSAEQQMRRFRLADVGEERILDEISGHSVEMLRFDPAYTVRMVSDLVPNAWIARAIVGRLLVGLTARGFAAKKLGALGGLIVEQLRHWLDGERDRMAEAVFRAAVAEGRIQFRLRTDDHNWRMPFQADTYEPEGAEQLIGKAGGPLTKSLFAPLYKGDFSSQDERNIAVYLDSEATLTWWHRNVARQQYGIQGWRRGRIYPDFIFALQRAQETNRVAVLEMKGPQLAGNLDTEYKRAVLRLMSDHYAVEQAPRVGEFELVDPGGTVVHCDLVLMPDWKIRLPNEFFGE